MSPAPPVPPHDFEAEQAVLGAALLDPEAAEQIADCPPEIFYVEKHRLVAGAITWLLRRGDPVDAGTVRAELQTAGKWQLVGDSTLALLGERGHIAAYVPKYLEIVRDLADRRELLQLGLTLTKAISGEDGRPTGDLIADSVTRLLALDAGRSEQIVPPGRFADELAHAPEVHGLSTGISLLDDLLAPGNLVVLAGRPGMGKTAIAVQIAYHQAVERLHGVLFCSLEMTQREIGLRLLSLMTGVNTRDLRAKRHVPGLLDHPIRRIRESGFHVTDNGELQLAAVQAHVRRSVAKHKANLAIVDHIGLIQVPHRESRYVEVGQIAQGLKATAKQLGIPILALAQLNRRVEARNSPRPHLSDLRDSGNIEEAADAVLFLWSEEERHESRDPLDVRLFLAKNRHGETSERLYRFEKSRSRFVEPASR